MTRSDHPRGILAGVFFGTFAGLVVSNLLERAFTLDKDLAWTIGLVLATALAWRFGQP